MNRLLHIDASIFQTPSVTRQLTADIVRKLLAKYPAAQATYRDVVAEEIRPLNAAIAAGFRAGNDDNVSEYIAKEHRLSDLLAAEFLASDVIVIGAPMYNFSVPAQLKSWLDRIAQAGKTFSYTAQGPVGLSGGRTVIVASARGGFYHGGSLEEWDFQERYLAAFFRFLGVEHIHVIRAEGASKGEAIQQREIGNAFNAASTLIQSLAL